MLKGTKKSIRNLGSIDHRIVQISKQPHILVPINLEHLKRKLPLILIVSVLVHASEKMLERHVISSD